MIISSRTPEGTPNSCAVCGADVCIDPAQPPGDAPCPNCGHLMWFSNVPVTIVACGTDQVFDNEDMEFVKNLQAEQQPIRLLVDVSNATTCSALLLSQLLNMFRQAGRRPNRFCLYNPSDQMREQLRVTALDTLFETSTDEREAMELLSW